MAPGRADARHAAGSPHQPPHPPRGQQPAGEAHGVLGKVFPNLYEIRAGKEQNRFISRLNWSRQDRKHTNLNYI